MRRCGGGEAAAAAEELETEGERQLKRLLRHQLDTAASLEQCVAKRHRFAPAAVYRPFGEEAAGARTLPEFRALQESSGEAASLQELGLSDAEIRLWRQRAQKGPGLGAAPEATRDRIRAIQEKIAERQRILSLPQHFAGSKSLSRREMEIENALFQGADRHPFLRMLYRPDEAQPKVASEMGPTSQLDAVYQQLLSEPLPSQRPLEPLKSSQKAPGSSCSAPFSSLGAAAAPAVEPVMVTEPVACVPEEEILRSRLSREEIRRIPRFSSYSPGEPSKVLYMKNLSRNATVKDLLPLFSRFQEKDAPPLRLRLLSGRMRGQAFLTFPTVSQAQEALELLNGFLLLGKPLILEFGRSGNLPSVLGSRISSALQENDGQSDKS
ncbi:RNA-binding protein 41 isoform X1 [Pseudonaja textilis]|uniref:RNA-binding protein 41 isoform X1 n=1 Tax=Pseudonaja textilis TaxID=8673 RepID=UPI000EA89F44|nr:RNA-binding protein 41 isoform X1 [Pseudonaja textilis]